MLVNIFHVWQKCINVKPVSIHMVEKYRMIYLASKRNACFRKIITHVNALAPLQGKAKQYFKLLFTIHQQVIFCTPNWNICYTSIFVFHIHYQVVIRNRLFQFNGIHKKHTGYQLFWYQQKCFAKLSYCHEKEPLSGNIFLSKHFVYIKIGYIFKVISFIFSLK